MIACMGGWCNSRESCGHYWSDSPHMAERLCDEMEEVERISHEVRRLGVREILGQRNPEILPDARHEKRI